jgi:medium-chain acyl-[acyl-carrier-protein] hydrolase
MTTDSTWTAQVRVSAHQSDFNRRWKPAAMFLAMLETSAAHSDRLGFDYESLMAHEMAWVLSRFRIHFHTFPEMGETVTIQTWPKVVQQRLFFMRDFVAQRADGTPLASATTAWLLINPHTRRILPPQSLPVALPLLPDRHAINLPLEKINPPEGLPERMLVQPGYSAIDIMGHANSARYIEWLCDAIGLETFRTQRLTWLQLNYNLETKPTDQLSLRLGPNGTPGEWLAEGYNLSEEKRGFEAAFGMEPVQN